MTTNVKNIFEKLKGCLPERDLFIQKFSIATYKALSKGSVVTLKELEKTLDISKESIAKNIIKYPGIQKNEDDDIKGFWGLAVNYKSPHQIVFNGVKLNTWCAWDTLFIPELVGDTAEVELTCPLSGSLINLTVGPKEISNISNNKSVISFVIPSELGENTIQNFCCYVHAFKNEETFNIWKNDGHQDCFYLSLQEAFEIGQLKNQYQFGEVL